MTPDLGCYVVIDAPSCADDPARIAAAAARGGAGCLQVRDKRAGGRALFELVRRVVQALDRPVPVLVNDRVDVAAAARSAGLAVAGAHVGQDDLPPTGARAVLGPDAVLGLSVSNAAELAAALREPAGTVDYLGLSPVFGTPTKPDAAPPLGRDGAAALAASASASASALPCVGIGGLTHADADWARRAGLAGLAVVSAVCAAADPEAATRELVRAWAGVPA